MFLFLSETKSDFFLFSTATTLPTTTEMTTTHVSTTTIVSTPTSTGSTTTIVSTPSTTTTEYCVHIELMSDNINIPLSKLKTPNNPGLSDEDKEKLRPNNQEFLNVDGGTFLVRLENIDAEITDITIEGSNIAEITVKYDDVLDNIESTTSLVCNLIKNIMPNTLTFPNELGWVL
jgi:hypothetical protein